MLTCLTTETDWRLVIVAVIACIVAGGTALRLFRRRLDTKGRLLSAALDSMTQGVVMFDAAERFIIGNQRYLQMYGLSSDVVKPGCTLLDIIRHRSATGSLGREVDQYRRELVAKMARGETTHALVESPDGRAISVTNRPIAGGYWVGIPISVDAHSPAFTHLATVCGESPDGHHS